MGYNYDGKVFVPKVNSENGEVSSKTKFYYHQDGSMVWGDYSGGEILKGHLIGVANDDSSLSFLYHHVNVQGEVRAGKCISTPKMLSDGRIELHESWQWLTGDNSSGASVIIEQ